MVRVHVAPPGRNRNFLRLPRAASAAAALPWAIFGGSLRDEKTMSIKREGKRHQSRQQNQFMRLPCRRGHFLVMAARKARRHDQERFLSLIFECQG